MRASTSINSSLGGSRRLVLLLFILFNLVSVCHCKKDDKVEEEEEHEYIFQDVDEDTGATTTVTSTTTTTTTSTTVVTGSPTTSPSANNREEEIILFLSPRFGDAATLSDDSTPQGQAVNWMANDDPLQLPIPPSQRYSGAYRFVQRYALAVLCFAWAPPTPANLPATTNTTSKTNTTNGIPFLTGDSECDWNDQIPLITGETLVIGAQCNALQEVDYINLPSMKLVGTIPDETALLLALTHLTLPYNQLEGGIPNRLQYLTGLSIIDLQQNAMTGNLPAAGFQKWTQLTSLALNGNKLTGVLPTQLVNMTSLTSLQLQNNELFGIIEILNFIPTLLQLNLASNSFAGRISQLSLVDLVNLQQLDLSDNFFQGTFPEDFLLTNSSVVHNDTTTMVVTTTTTTTTTTVGRHGGHDFNPELQFLRLHSNQFAGNLDETLLNLPNLIALDVSDNVFTGTLPQVDTISNLQFLSLASNPWQPGPIPWGLISTTQFKELNLGDTNRNGNIPTWLGINHFDLELLALDNNDLEGTIPESIGDIASLRYLLLQNNKLEGTLPVSMANLQQLEVLRMDGNRLAGSTAPICLPNSTALVLFAADCTDFDDECPCCTHCTRCWGCDGDTEAVLATNTWTHRGGTRARK
ncbi:serine threonine-protein kinase BRI1-like [Seminavis robusta]|uniref:Serine threonine-protein kinase BRI1-like n=1 Tax=Seminavis robusta TaxID=568900 RepID=A0A9N8H6T0_9STRA|nr:serine threonine-protein kinase BRI1-like [Seminavis robusta]|eukprot:Sro121_g058760.1 serine threonine-protein kinase BRI1-like (638) ;mRNA; f:17743-19782